MATPAPARKPSQGSPDSSSQRQPQWFVSKVGPEGWDALPAIVWKHLPKCCTGDEYKTIVILDGLTVGDHERGRPEWAAFTQAELAEMLGGSEDGAFKVLQSLEKKRLIESRAAGRYKRREYRLAIENFASAEELTKREIKEEKEKPPVKVGAGKMAVSPRSWSPLIVFGRPIEQAKLRNMSGLPFELDHDIDSEGSFIVSINLKEDVPYSSTEYQRADRKGTSQKGEQKVNRTPVRKMSDQLYERIVQLREFLAPIFRDFLGKKIDDQFLRDIDSRLGDAPISSYMRVVRNRLHSRDPHHSRRTLENVKSGLFLILADDAAHDLKAHPHAKKDASGEVSKKRSYASEPEESCSVWMQIRLALKSQVSSKDYVDWIEPTAFQSFDDASGELLVHVPDAVTEQWLRQEFGEQIDGAISTLELPVRKITYVVDGEVV